MPPRTTDAMAAPAAAAAPATGAASGQAPDTVIFDIGGVLLDWNPRYLYRQLFQDPAEMEGFLARICTSEWHRGHDLGEDTLRSCQHLARQHPAYRDLIMAWAERGEEMIAGQFDETVEILGALKAAGVRCYALSNMERETFPLRRRRFGFLEWFDGHVISGIEGVAKPDRKIFQILLARHRLDPGAAVFIDDSPPNVAAAGELGLTALRFTSAPQLRADLQALGLRS
ncbi:MAG TPA: HAD family phosphatase [Streptosporangiaceae bacterium]|nr:HAD family phosphatase [Streptosporangiaceae bacterium]